MSYYFSKTLPFGFDEAVRRTAEALKQEGFGIITEIDVRKTFKEKLGVDFRGQANPGRVLPDDVVLHRHAIGRHV